MNYLVAAACIGFLTGEHLDLPETLKAGGYQGYAESLDASGFAARIASYLNMYSPDVTRVQLNLLDSHDTPRFLTCASGDLDSLRLALTFLLTYPGAPCLFYGDEIGLTGRQDPECRPSFPWDSHKWNLEMHGFTRDLIQLRRAHRAFRWGDFRVLAAAGSIFAFVRTLGDESFLVVLNAGASDGQVVVPAPGNTGRVARVLGDPKITIDGVSTRISIPARAPIIVSI
jgi:neopullulanase